MEEEDELPRSNWLGGVPGREVGEKILSALDAVEERVEELMQSSLSTVLASDKEWLLKEDTLEGLCRLSLVLQVATTAAPTLLAALLRRREVLRAVAVAQAFVLAADGLVVVARPNAIAE